MNCSNCGAELAGSDRFCRKCGTPRPPDTGPFKKAEDEYFRLKGQLSTGRLSAEQFTAETQRLTVQDVQGRYWRLSEDTGDWLVFDGLAWVRGEPYPPSPPTESKAPPASPPPSQGWQSLPPGGPYTQPLPPPVPQQTQPLPPPMPQPVMMPPQMPPSQSASPPTQQWQPTYVPNPYTAPPPTQQWQAQAQPQPPVVAVAQPVAVPQKKSRAGCCVGSCLLAVLVLCGGPVLLWFLIQNGTIAISQREIMNTLGFGTGEASIQNLTDGTLDISLEPITTGTPDPYANSTLTIEPAESDTFTQISPGRYKLTFSSNLDGSSSECSIKVDSGDVYTFMAIPEGIAILRDKEPPNSSEDVNLTTSPLCQR